MHDDIILHFTRWMTLPEVLRMSCVNCYVRRTLDDDYFATLIRQMYGQDFCRRMELRPRVSAKPTGAMRTELILDKFNVFQSVGCGRQGME